jgi:hypothetical protein
MHREGDAIVWQEVYDRCRACGQWHGPFVPVLGLLKMDDSSDARVVVQGENLTLAQGGLYR